MRLTKLLRRSPTILILSLLTLAQLGELSLPIKAQTEPLTEKSLSSLKSDVNIYSDNNDTQGVNVYSLCPIVVTNCNDYLTDRAIAKSILIQSLNQKISRTNEQIDYLTGEIEFYKSRSWTDYITLQPLEILENLFGGGKPRETKLRIIDLETKVSELEDNKIRLENELIIKQEEIKNEVAIALLNIEENRKTIELIEKKIQKTKLQNQVFLIKYSNGEGTTNQYLSYQ